MSLLEEHGVDPENIEWQDLALCINMELSWFYNDYENDTDIAAQVDQACLTCPVIKQCGLRGLDGEYGVWGGIYWAGNGKPDKAKNAHKTPEVWEEIRERYL